MRDGRQASSDILQLETDSPGGSNGGQFVPAIAVSINPQPGIIIRTLPGKRSTNSSRIRESN
jgi:hypothetical protein